MYRVCMRRFVKGFCIVTHKKLVCEVIIFMFINQHRPLTNSPYGCSHLENDHPWENLSIKLISLTLFNNWPLGVLETHFYLCAYKKSSTKLTDQLSDILFPTMCPSETVFLDRILCKREYLCHFFLSGCFGCGRVKKNDYDVNWRQLNKVTLGCFGLVETLKALKMLLKLYGFFSFL